MNSVRFIVLNTTKYGDRRLIIHALSREYSRRGIIVSVGGSASKGRRASMALYQPLSILEGEVAESMRGELLSLKNVEMVHPLAGIRNNVHKNTMSLFMAELLFRAMKEDDSEEGLYDWCESEILALNDLEAGFSNFHIRFLFDFAAALGFAPSAEAIAPFFAESASEHYELVEKSAGFITSDLAEALALPLNGAERNCIAEAMIRYIEFHLDSPLRVKSLPILHELYR